MVPSDWRSNDALAAAFAEAEAHRRLHRLVETTAPEQPPLLRVVAGELDDATSVAVLPGSFNPLTAAHVGLADAAVAAGLGSVAFALSTRTVDKERPDGALLEDRLLMLELHCRPRPRRAAVLVNRGLYVDQARLFRDALPRLKRLTFLVGFDKIVQIFDPRYYADRDAALDELFALAELAVAPRAGAAEPELAGLLARPENLRYATRVRPMALDPSLADLSASAIRAALSDGRPLPPDLPSESAAFIRATGCYAPAVGGPGGRARDRYAERARLLGYDAP